MSGSAKLPEAVHAHAAFATCDVTYRVENGTLFAERRLAVLQSKVPIEDFKKYQAWYDESGASGYPYIQLIPPPKAVPPRSSLNPKLPKPPPTPLAAIPPTPRPPSSCNKPSAAFAP